MKRLLAIAVAFSLAANLVFLIRASHPRPSSSAETRLPDAVPRGASSFASELRESTPAFSAADWRALQDGAPSTLAVLRQLSFSDAQLRAIARAEVDARFANRERALLKSPAYWESTFDAPLRSSRDPWKDPVAARALLHEKESELRRMLGDAYEPADPRLRRYAGYLPFEKAWQLQTLDDDYQRLRNKLNEGDGRLRLPVSSDDYHYLRQQQRTDTEALLTPDELRTHDLYSSRTATFFGNLSGFNATAGEFRVLHAILEPLERVLNNPGLTAELREKENVAERQVRETLGEQRYADYQRAKDPAFRFNRELAALLNKPADTALAGYESVKSFRDKASTLVARNDLTENEMAARRTALLREAETAFTTLYGEEGFATARTTLASQIFDARP